MLDTQCFHTMPFKLCLTWCDEGKEVNSVGKELYRVDSLSLQTENTVL